MEIDGCFKIIVRDSILINDFIFGWMLFVFLGIEEMVFNGFMCLLGIFLLLFRKLFFYFSIDLLIVSRI